MAPILINTAEPMSRIRVVTVRDDSERTLKVLQKTGVIHVEESSELQPADKAVIEQEHREVGELFGFISRVLGYLPRQDSVTLDEDVEVIYTRPFSEISDEVRRLYNKSSKLQEKIESLSRDISHLGDLQKYLEPLSEKVSLNLKDLDYTGRYLVTRVIAVPTESYDNLHNALTGYCTENVVSVTGDDTVMHVVADAKHRETIEVIVENAGGRILEVPAEDVSVKDYLASLTGSLAALEEDKGKLTDELSREIGTDLKRLVLLREALSAENDRLAVLEKAGQANYVTLVEGWIPDNIIETATADIKEQIDYAYIETRKPEEGEEPPTQYRNPGGFKPFQIVVNLFATPKYREWDPTPIVTYSFAFFFGLMVCDVLYALGLALLAKFVLKFFVDDPTTDTFRQFQRLIYTCSGVAFIGGLLTGQYFGDILRFVGIENIALVKSVQEALQDPVTFIVIALLIGFVHVNIGYLLAFVKAIKERDTGNIINKLGLFLLQFGIPTILHSMMGVNLPGFTDGTYSILMYALYGGIVLIFASNLMINKGLGSILWLFDITGILGDIMSYARLAGVGLATYYLAFTFNMMADIFTGMMGGGIGTVIGIILSVFVIAFGHIINMVLTAITGFMHSLRLCFVEFLFKFYEGGGTEYNPFRLKKRTTVPVLTRS